MLLYFEEFGLGWFLVLRNRKEVEPDVLYSEEFVFLWKLAHQCRKVFNFKSLVLGNPPRNSLQLYSITRLSPSSPGVTNRNVLGTSSILNDELQYLNRF